MNAVAPLHLQVRYPDLLLLDEPLAGLGEMNTRGLHFTLVFQCVFEALEDHRQVLLWCLKSAGSATGRSCRSRSGCDMIRLLPCHHKQQRRAAALPPLLHIAMLPLAETRGQGGSCVNPP